MTRCQSRAGAGAAGVVRGGPAFPSAGGRPRLAGRLGGGTARCRPRLSGGGGAEGRGHAAARPCPQHARSEAGPVASSVPRGPMAGQPSRSGLLGPQPGWRPGICRVGAVPQRLCARWAWRGPTRRLNSHVGPWRSMLSLFRTQPQQAWGLRGVGPGLHTTSPENVTQELRPHAPQKASRRTA